MTLFAVGASRKLRRGDVVELPIRDCFLPGRMWRRIDADHVQVIDTFQHVSIYREDHLKLSDYPGHWAWLRHPGNDYGHRPKFITMTSLKRLKKLASRYNAHFRNAGGRPKNWTKQDQLEALSEREVSIPDTLVSNIIWDKEVDSVEQDVDLPEIVILRSVNEDEIVDELSRLYNYCVKSFTSDNTPSFPGYKK